jgi:hypothetical protein
MCAPIHCFDYVKGASQGGKPPSQTTPRCRTFNPLITLRALPLPNPALHLGSKVPGAYPCGPAILPHLPPHPPSHTPVGAGLNLLLPSGWPDVRVSRPDRRVAGPSRAGLVSCSVRGSPSERTSAKPERLMVQTRALGLIGILESFREIRRGLKTIGER